MAAYRGPLAGLATITINGDVWSVVGEAQWQASGLVNETLKGQSAVEGFASMPGQGFIQATLRDRRDAKVSDLQGASGLTVILELANGKVITAVDAWQTENINVNTQEGTFELHVESDTVTEDTV
ncbi:phage tail protein [Acetobacter tropicalis]|uniref:Phage tail tube protein n=1 Tax=Acetobacter tropicalis TaxID=104102 RepID=A0A094YGL5_9PROT|nr:phage tail tube protein [Acetobacter tropicalis]KAA8387040.1 phage tail protein [Acetobacter tropicalis]KAA8391385.1 phage tail protein [Acetobacter tropicalis]KGB21170.1 Phage tail tube protein [Acetobacter tropicalis]MBC9008793.1 phage tail tube protein [Acetobacter tropicalis]MDO8171966.1 phage tail tube protein [Acetobacter tropicalis]